MEGLLAPYYTITDAQDSEVFRQVPKEKPSPVWFGFLVHVAPVILSTMLFFEWGTSVSSALLATLPISFVSLAIAEVAAILRPTVKLPPLTLPAFLQGFVWNVFGKGFVIALISLTTLYHLFKLVLPFHLDLPLWLSLLITSLAVDLWYYSLHRFFLHGKIANSFGAWGRRQHAVHHSVKELDFSRGNKGSLLDNGFMSFPLPLAIFSVLFGLDLGSSIFIYVVLMAVQITHHVNHSFDIGIFRYVFFDSHAHKYHHCRKGHLINFSGIFAFWDRLFGTYYEDWNLAPSYLHAHRIPLPIKPKKAIG